MSGWMDEWMNGHKYIVMTTWNIFLVRPPKEALLTSTSSLCLILLVVQCLFAPQTSGVLASTRVMLDIFVHEWKIAATSSSGSPYRAQRTCRAWYKKIYI